jgi:hypothetical protein
LDERVNLIKLLLDAEIMAVELDVGFVNMSIQVSNM